MFILTLHETRNQRIHRIQIHLHFAEISLPERERDGSVCPFTTDKRLSS